MKGLEARLRKLEECHGNPLAVAFRRYGETDAAAIERARTFMATEPRRWVVMTDADDRL